MGFGTPSQLDVSRPKDDRGRALGGIALTSEMFAMVDAGHTRENLVEKEGRAGYCSASGCFSAFCIALKAAMATSIMAGSGSRVVSC